MGRDKAALTLEGETLLAIAVEILRPLVRNIFVVGGPDRYPETQNLQDLIPDAGPLSGILTALCASTSELLLVRAVDLPLIATSTLQDLIAASKGADITMIRTPDGRKHPLCAVYSKRCIEPARKSLILGLRRVEHLLEYNTLSVRILNSEEIGGIPEEFTNINTPEDMEKARKLLSGRT